MKRETKHAKCNDNIFLDNTRDVCDLLLPAAKPLGPRTVRVVGVGGGRDRDPTPKKIYIADIEN